MVVCQCVWKGLLNVFGFLRRGSSRPEMWSTIGKGIVVADAALSLGSKGMNLLWEAKRIGYVL